VVVLAQEEARMLRHNYIGTEHLLLGLLREEEGLAARVLESLNVTVERVRAEVARIVGLGEEVTSGQIPFTPRAKKVLELALHESLSLGHNYIGTEHILLGLARENEEDTSRTQGIAARTLLDLGADPEKIRNEMIRMLSSPQARRYAEATQVVAPASRHPIDQAWFDGLGAVLNGLAREIRRQLEREPDTGDLLLALAWAPDTLAAQALHQLGVNLDELPGVIERIRASQASAEKELAERIEEVRRAKEQAIESQQFQTAARMRDQERELTQQTRTVTVVAPEVIQQIRRQLGIPTQTDDPPRSPEAS
jgi:ATP-dependent Clp protease ATP-binding subunit ClpA